MRRRGGGGRDRQSLGGPGAPVQRSRARRAVRPPGSMAQMAELAEIIEPGPCLEHDGGSAGDDLTFNGGAKTGSVLSLTRGPSPGCLQRPAFPASPGARNTRPSWRLSKRRPPKPCLPFEPRSGRQANRGLGSGRGPHRPEDRPRPHPGAQGDEDRGCRGRSRGRLRIRARKGTRPRGPADQRYKPACLSGAVCADRQTGAALMLPWCHSAMGGHWNKEPASQGDQPARCKRRSCRRPDGPRAGAHIRRGEGSEDPDPDLPANQITGAQSGREGLAISSGERA